MNNVPLKILIIDSEKAGRDNLKKIITGFNDGLSVVTLDAIDKAEKIISDKGINTIYIDPISINLDNSENFIFKIREKFPYIVFVLYYDFDEQFEDEHYFFSGQRKRFRHYYKLNKTSRESEFPQNVYKTIYECQGYLSLYMKKEPIDRLKTELNQLQQKTDTSDLSSLIPSNLITQIIDQLDKRIHDLKYEVPIYRNASFLGPPSPKPAIDNCFIIMPFSQSWSSAVEQVLCEFAQKLVLNLTLPKLCKGDLYLMIFGKVLLGQP